MEKLKALIRDLFEDDEREEGKAETSQDDSGMESDLPPDKLPSLASKILIIPDLALSVLPAGRRRLTDHDAPPLARRAGSSLSLAAGV